MVLVDVFVERDSSHTAFFAMLDRLCFDEAEGVLVLAEQHWDDEFRMLAAQFIDDSGAWLYVVREVEHSS
ncbi:hypothetical protein LI90_3481 [Carbonactinospora thermoautotrophica]|nr:hypothetical protein LI90_3481 [Carbonactinospora thermoautotrophica]